MGIVIHDSMTGDEVTKASDREMYKVKHQRAVDDFRKASGRFLPLAMLKRLANCANRLTDLNVQYR